MLIFVYDPLSFSDKFGDGVFNIIDLLLTLSLSPPVSRIFLFERLLEFKLLKAVLLKIFLKADFGACSVSLYLSEVMKFLVFFKLLDEFSEIFTSSDLISSLWIYFGLCIIYYFYLFSLFRVGLFSCFKFLLNDFVFIVLRLYFNTIFLT